MKKILMVCLGNICRSPLAHGILESKLPSNDFFVDSAGTANYHVGDLPDQRSIEVARNNGLDITDQRGRQFKVRDFDDFDHIYVMDQSNYADVIYLARNEDDRNKVKLILEELYPNSGTEVADPYYGGRKGFDIVFQQLDEVCEIIADNLIRS
ncbi:low molecular weight protein-tyrosine-phosphatase [Aegicerativicinus sediminis]|uniref:low molecular weight protein-tyrosine-phosphatase n=1 Tax=Aegicerativicinus sediminis TaxID=2893202 RepID=UPI001E4DF581|nr:low molecular weight protein-tyrosine-phosphatase [Aegicerativicinus sediminis]